MPPIPILPHDIPVAHIVGAYTVAVAAVAPCLPTTWRRIKALSRSIAHQTNVQLRRLRAEVRELNGCILQDSVTISLLNLDLEELQAKNDLLSSSNLSLKLHLADSRRDAEQLRWTIKARDREICTLNDLGDLLELTEAPGRHSVVLNGAMHTLPAFANDAASC